MSVTIFDALASASAPVSSGCCTGRSGSIYSYGSSVAFQSPSFVDLTTQFVDVVLLGSHLPKRILNRLGVSVGRVFSTGRIDIINVLGCEK
eukprot:5972373-Pyramimonas_sp.AAC.1